MVKSGIIYKIYDQTDKKLVYYGSTEQSISKRLGGHISDYKSYINGSNPFVTSFLVIDADDYDITIVERVEFDDIKELRNRERFYIENNICVNERIPNRPKTEYQAEWYQENKDKILEQQAEYRKVNKMKISEYQVEYRKVNKEQKAQYYKANKDKILEEKAQYYKANKDKIAEQRAERYQENKAKINEKFSCICGGSYTYINKSRHENSIKHTKYIASCEGGK